MMKYVAVGVVLWITAVVPAQFDPSVPDHRARVNRFSQRSRRPGAPARERARGRRPTTRIARWKELNRQGNEIEKKIRQLAPWDAQAREFEQTVNEVWQSNRLNGETEQALKHLLIETNKHPPWEMDKRLDTAVGIIGERYNLAEPTRRHLRGLIIGQSLRTFMKHGSTIIPVAREMLDHRLAGKPFTPQQIAAWTKRLRPVVEDAHDDTLRSFQREIKTLTPEQQQAINKDLVVINKRFGEFKNIMRHRWEAGKWEPRDWGLQHDAIQMRGGVAVADRGVQSALKRPPVPKSAAPPAGAGGPMRIGESQPGVVVAQQPKGSPLPDESLWVAYVRKLCDRYGLDKAQRGSAYAILKDMQEQAQAYRGSRSEDIQRLQTQLRRAESAEERKDPQAELREVLSGVDRLFGELKARLQNIPTQEQIRRGG